MGRATYCLNGHFLDHEPQGEMDDDDDWPAVNAWEEQRLDRKYARLAYCSECGAKGVFACAQCGSPIIIRQLFSDRPSYCSICGMAFPWTEIALRTAGALADESEELSDQDKATLKASLPALTINTPETQLSIVRFQKLATKAGPVIGRGLWEIIKGVAPSIVKDVIEGKMHF